MTPAVLVAICSVLIAAGSLIFSRVDRWKDRKRLIGISYSETKLIPGAGDSWKSLGVNYELAGNVRELAEPRFLTATLTNIGTVPSSPAANEKAIARITHGSIVDAKVWMIEPGVDPEELTPQELTDRLVVAPQEVLNPGCSYRFELLVDGGTGLPQANLRAEGFRCIPPAEAAKRVRRVLVARITSLVFGVLGLVTAVLSLL